MLYKIIVPGKPVAKDRPRVNKGGKLYTTQKTKTYEELVNKMTKEVMKEPLKGDVKVSIKIYANKLRSDIDNVAKAILDGMTNAAYLNDRQVKILNVEIIDSLFERAEIDVIELEERRRDSVFSRFGQCVY